MRIGPSECVSLAVVAVTGVAVGYALSINYVPVVYGETSSAKLLMGPDVGAMKVPCYKGSLNDHCYSVFCKPPEKTLAEPVPESSSE